VIYSVKKLIGPNEENIGKWVRVSTDEFEAIQDSLTGENYARGAIGKGSLRLYRQNDYVVACTQSIQAEPHPNGSK